jgi:hypothetical protein
VSKPWLGNYLLESVERVLEYVDFLFAKFVAVALDFHAVNCFLEFFNLLFHGADVPAPLELLVVILDDCQLVLNLLVDPNERVVQQFGLTHLVDLPIQFPLDFIEPAEALGKLAFQQGHLFADEFEALLHLQVVLRKDVTE